MLDLLLESVQNVADEARGHWWTVSEASAILDFDEKRLYTLLENCKRKPQTVTDATGIHIDSCRLQRGEKRQVFLYLPKNGEAPSSTMHSEAERALRPDFETVCRQARRHRRSLGGASEDTAMHLSLSTPVRDINRSSRRKSFKGAQFSSADIGVTSVTCGAALLPSDPTVGAVDETSDEFEREVLSRPMDVHSGNLFVAVLLCDDIISEVSKFMGVSASFRLSLIGCRSSYRTNPQVFVRCNGFTGTRIAFTSTKDNLFPRLEAFKRILVSARKRVASNLTAHSTWGRRITGVSDERATGNRSFYVFTEPVFQSSNVPPVSWYREKEVVSQVSELIGHVIRAPGCFRIARVARSRVPSHLSICSACSHLNDPLNEVMNSQIRRQLTPISPYLPHSYVAQFPDLAEKRMADQSNRIRKVEAEKKRLEAVRFVQEHGEKLDPDPVVSQLNDGILSVHVQATKALEEAGCGEDTLEHQIWNACVESARTAQASGSKYGVRYPRFVIRFAIGLLAKVGKNAYESLHEIFQLPTGRYLRTFSSSSPSDPDGIMFEALEDLKTLADRFKLTTSQRRMFLALDGCNLKSGVYFDANKGKIIGFASDVFEDVDVMAATRQFVRSALEESRLKPEALPLADTYMVFYLSAVQPEVSLKSPVARFCISSSKAAWLLKVILHVIVEACNYSFTVVGVVCDGASENRSALSALATVPARHFLQSMEGQKISVATGVGGGLRSGVVRILHKLNFVRVCYDIANDEGDDDFEDIDLEKTRHIFSEMGCTFHRAPFPKSTPLDQKIAFEHPIIPKVFVFILQDMPHVVKRIVNALERSNSGGKRNLTKVVNGRHEPVCLRMIYDVWCALGGQSASQIRFNKLTEAHFKKDAYSRMRVPLAVQVVSASTARMLEYAVQSPSVQLPGKHLFGSLIEFCKKCDRLVDIMNGAGVHKGAPLLSTPHAAILYEAIDILGFFAAWKVELVDAGLDPKSHFLCSELDEDISGMILALTCMARHELHKYPGTAICQRRGQQDVVEHHFAHARGGLGDGRNMMAYQALQRTSLAQAQRAASQGSNCLEERIVDNTELPSEERRRRKRRVQKEKAKLRRSAVVVGVAGGSKGAEHSGVNEDSGGDADDSHGDDDGGPFLLKAATEHADDDNKGVLSDRLVFTSMKKWRTKNTVALKSKVLDLSSSPAGITVQGIDSRHFEANMTSLTSVYGLFPFPGSDDPMDAVTWSKGTGTTITVDIVDFYVNERLKKNWAVIVRWLEAHGVIVRFHNAYTDRRKHQKGSSCGIVAARALTWAIQDFSTFLNKVSTAVSDDILQHANTILAQAGLVPVDFSGTCKTKFLSESKILVLAKHYMKDMGVAEPSADDLTAFNWPFPCVTIDQLLVKIAQSMTAGVSGRSFFCANSEGAGSSGFHWVSCIVDITVEDLAQAPRNRTADAGSSST